MSGFAGMMVASYKPTAGGGGGGGSDPNTQLLLHFEGSDGDSTFTDSSQNAFTFIRYNPETYITTSDYKFGSSSFYNSSNGGVGKGLYRTGTRPSVLACQGNFTVECWAKLNSSGAVQAIFGLGQALFNLVFIRGTEILVVEKSTSGTYGSGFKEVDFTLPSGCYSGTWRHYAFVRNGDTAAFYVDGTACSSTGASASTFFSDGSPSTGADHSGNTGVYVGDMSNNFDYGFRLSLMDDLRFSDTARYTGNFTPPTSSLT
jgi:hypothetical protein